MGKFKKYVSGEYQLQIAHAASFKNDNATVKQIKKIVKQIKPDIVYVHSTKAGALTRIALIGMNIPVIYNPHGWAFNIIQSKKKECPESYLFCRQNSSYYNGVDFELLDDAKNVTRNELGISKDAFVVGQIGRLTEQKSPDI